MRVYKARGALVDKETETDVVDELQVLYSTLSLPHCSQHKPTLQHLRAAAARRDALYDRLVDDLADRLSKLRIVRSLARLPPFADHSMASLQSESSELQRQQAAVPIQRQQASASKYHRQQQTTCSTTTSSYQAPRPYTIIVKVLLLFKYDS